MLLCDHPEGHNKTQDKYKSDEFGEVDKHTETNAYCIK